MACQHIGYILLKPLVNGQSGVSSSALTDLSFMNECRRVSLFALVFVLLTPSNGFLGRFTSYAYMRAWRVWKVEYLIFSYIFAVTHFIPFWHVSDLTMCPFWMRGTHFSCYRVFRI